ncbi:MAG: hypothetical protein FWC64_09110 [Treponema sp.]|nr:hypothetical protein [Treponema sp.]
MTHEKPLSDMYQRYLAGDLPRKDFEGRMFQYLLDNHERYRVLEGNSYHWNEFLSWLYPRLARAIDLYRDVGSSFDAYIAALVYSACKEYRYREADHRATEYVCWQAKAQEMSVCESEGEYPEFCADASIPDGVNPRHILLLLLKSYHLASYELVNHVARAIGMETDAVMKMIDEIKKLRHGKEAEILGLRDRLYCQHYRCLAYQRRVDAAQPGTDYRKKMEDRCQRAKQRFRAMKKRLGKMRFGASNRMIADVMGIPKGTVDSGLFAVKNRMASFADNAT